MIKPIHILIVCIIALSTFNGQKAFSSDSAVAWPEPTAEARPWSRWWWMGSAVDKNSLTELLEQYSQAGLGGVEICPIYGAKGYEDKFLDFLSPQWVAMLDHTITQAAKDGMKVDLTTGTGWPFGGPMIGRDISSAGIILQKISFTDGNLSEPLPEGTVQCLTAISSDGDKTDVTNKVKVGKLKWKAPDDSWALLAAIMKTPVQKVKRPAPGGDGYVMDPYSKKSLNSYLSTFDAPLDKLSQQPRSHFHDSFEYYGATWTPDFFNEFEARRGYDLRNHIEALFGIGDNETISRVMNDYHQTINDLHIEVVKQWTKWCNSKGSLSRNQAHGAPANLVDLYGASNIPETEIFRSVEQRQYPMLKFSSSASHLNGSKLASSETFTWLNEHFQTNLTDLKEATDFMFLSGINHIFFHGIPFSPKDAPWPGWQFYASVNFSPDGGLWKDLPAYNAYVTRCQSILQSGKPDNDILLYMPIYDLWNSKSKLHMTFTVHNQDEWLYPSSFHRAAMQIWNNGYTYDAVSDTYLQKASYKDGKIIINDAAYDTIVIPQTHYMPVATLTKLLDLAQKGATILFQEKLPSDVPGLKDLKQRQNQLRKLLSQIQPNIAAINDKSDTLPPASIVKSIGSGKVMIADLLWMLKNTEITKEGFTDKDINFIRKRTDNGYDYFIVNQTKKDIEGWITLGKTVASAAIMDPLTDNHIGKAALKSNHGKTEIYLQLKSKESFIIRTFTDKDIAIAAWEYANAVNTPVVLEGEWKVDFIEGGPVLPESQTIDTLASWTTFADKETTRFCGTARYTHSFEAPNMQADNWMLDLGKVCNSARVSLNGKYIDTLWFAPFKINIGPYLTKGTNTIQIDITNLAANRIRDLDINKVNWKYFYNINVVNINYKPFDASDWPIFDSGLIGPVKLVPLKDFSPLEKANTQTSKPTVYIIGDSTVHNNGSNLMGWGDAIGKYFDKEKITVKNFARGGRSSRTFITEGLWNNVLNQLKPGDYVLMQFGHNDGGPIDTGRARASLKGTGDTIKDVIINGKPETVHTYGWYMSKYITDTQGKKATPVVISQVPRNRWINGEIERASNSYGKWAKESAQEHNAIFIDLNNLVADEYAKLSEDKLYELYFPKDHTHTSAAGAELNAKTLINAIRQLENCQLPESIANN